MNLSLRRPDGVNVAVQIHNPHAQGLPVLLTHGFAATAGMWEPNIAALTADRPVIAWEQRGHGATDAPSDMSQYGQDISVADMAAILDAAGARRAVLCGMSLGGYLSLAFYLAHPQRVAALVLVDTGPGFRNDQARQKWNDWVERYAQRLENGSDTTPASTEVANAVHEHPEGLPRAARGAMVQHDSRVISSLETVSVPTLVVVGADDTDFLAGADYLHRHIPDSRKLVIDNAGHAANMDQPAAFNTAVRDFLASL